MKITRGKLKQYLSYDPDTGIFIWLFTKSANAVVGTVAGTIVKPNGYNRIQIDGKRYLSHRLAFLYMTGSMPEFCDHINRVRTDNRWCNLRSATITQNACNSIMYKNNKTGYRGVSFNKARNKFVASISPEGKDIHIGSFDCKHHAFCEYVLASRKHFGEFSAI